MHTFRQPRRLRAQAGWAQLLPLLIVALSNLWTVRSWRYGLWSVPFGVQAALLSLLGGILLAAAFDQRRRQVVVAPDGLHTRRLGRSAFVPWRDIRDVQVSRTWLGDYVVVATPNRMVRLDAPYLVVSIGAARREFDATAGELQRAIGEQVFMRRAGER